MAWGVAWASAAASRTVLGTFVDHVRREARLARRRLGGRGQRRRAHAHPNRRISDAAVALAARAETLVVRVGEMGVRLYPAGQPWAALWRTISPAALSERAAPRQERAAESPAKNVFIALWRRRSRATPRRAVAGYGGRTGQALCKLHARENAVNCRRRDHNPSSWSGPDTPNRFLNAATTCLYGLAEAAILAPGYASAIGVIHAEKPQSFVYDVADVYKFETVALLGKKTHGERRWRCLTS